MNLRKMAARLLAITWAGRMMDIGRLHIVAGRPRYPIEGHLYTRVTWRYQRPTSADPLAQWPGFWIETRWAYLGVSVRPKDYPYAW